MGNTVSDTVLLLTSGVLHSVARMYQRLLAKVRRSRVV
jgi:hypothetical protein